MLGEAQHAACGSSILFGRKLATVLAKWCGPLTFFVLRRKKKRKGKEKRYEKKLRGDTAGKGLKPHGPTLITLYHTTQMLWRTICSFKFEFLRLDLEKLGMTAGRSTANYPRPVFQVARLCVHVCSSDTDVVTFRGCWRLASY